MQISTIICTCLITIYYNFTTILAQPAFQETLTDGSPVIGKNSKAKTGRGIVEFLGIPFAEPPIGPLRFKKPVPKAPWREPFMATKLPSSCMQTPDDAFGEFQ